MGSIRPRRGHGFLRRSQKRGLRLMRTQSGCGFIAITVPSFYIGQCTTTKKPFASYLGFSPRKKRLVTGRAHRTIVRTSSVGSPLGFSYRSGQTTRLIGPARLSHRRQKTGNWTWVTTIQTKTRRFLAIRDDWHSQWGRARRRR